MFAVLLVPLLALLGVVASAGAASASSTKCAWYGTEIRWGVRNGSFSSTVNGSGSYISYVTGNFGTTVAGLNTVCNPSIKMDVYDRYGRWVTWRQGAQKSGCYPWAFNDVPSIGVWSSFAQACGGSVRVTLQSYGQPVVANWHGLGC